MNTRKFLTLEWDAIAGIIAAVIATILHLLHIVDEHVILPIILALIALLFINFLRHTKNTEAEAEQLAATRELVAKIQTSLASPEVVLIGPGKLHEAYDSFLRSMKGDVLWFNVCLSMYQSERQFTAMMRPALENQKIDSIAFILDNSQKELWDAVILPRIEQLPSATVKQPQWRCLSKTIALIISDYNSPDCTEALISFWGEPFMSEHISRSVPRFVLHVHPHSELLSYLKELIRSHRFALCDSDTP